MSPRNFLWFCGVVFLFQSISISALPSDPQIIFLEVSGAQRQSTTARYIGDKTAIYIDNLNPNKIYSLKMSLNYGTQRQVSLISVKPDSRGVIDTSTTPAISGSYSGVDADGLFWSMATDPTPVPQAPSAYRISVELEGKEIVTRSLTNGFLKPGVKRVALNGTGLVGTLFIPNTNEPRPAVIAYGGSEGGVLTGTINAVALANKGFVALGLGYFGAPGLPDTLTNVPLEYFKKAIKYLQSRPEVKASAIGVMGPSRGGELSLLLGATFREIKAVVAMVPSPMRWSANDDSTNSEHPNAAWTFKGKAPPFLKAVGEMDSWTLPDGRTVFTNKPIFERAMQSKKNVLGAMNPIEKTKGPILLLGAEDDQVWPSCVLAKIAMKRLKKRHHHFKDEIVCYPNAGHAGIGVPVGSTTTSNLALHPQMKIWLNLGGTPAGNASAQRKSWEKIQDFLSKNLK